MGTRPDTLIHLYRDIDAVSEEFGIPVDEEGLAGRECDLVDPDGNRLRVATRRVNPSPLASGRRAPPQGK